MSTPQKALTTFSAVQMVCFKLMELIFITFEWIGGLKQRKSFPVFLPH